MEQCRSLQLHVDFPAIVIDCGGNVAKAFNSTLEWDWLHCGCHLIHNVVKAGLNILKNHALNPAQTMVVILQEALDRLVVLSFHSIVAQIICMLCQKNMCAMWYIPASSLCTYIFGKVHGPVYPTLISYINFHVPTSYIWKILGCRGNTKRHCRNAPLLPQYCSNTLQWALPQCCCNTAIAAALP